MPNNPGGGPGGDAGPGGNPPGLSLVIGKYGEATFTMHPYSDGQKERFTLTAANGVKVSVDPQTGEILS
jgi:hypothetical protein